MKTLFFICFLSLFSLLISVNSLYSKEYQGPVYNKISKALTINVSELNDTHLLSQPLSVDGSLKSENDLSPYISFSGIQSTALNPPDPVIAVGPNHVVNVVNAMLAIYDKNGNMLNQSTLSDWFSNMNPPSMIFDPKIAYDHYDDRWILLVLSKDTDNRQSFYLISISQTSDPTGDWYNYKSDAAKNGDISSNLWADFPGLGYDQEAVYLTSNQFSFYSREFQYSKIRILDKSQLYSGQEVTYADFWDMKDDNGECSFSIKPTRNYGTVSEEYLINKRIPEKDGNYLTLWAITTPLNSPNLNKKAVLTVKEYYPPVYVRQNGDTYKLNVFSAGNITNAVYREGYLYCASTTAHNWGGLDVNAISYYKIDTETNTLVWDIIYGKDNVSYFLPAIDVNKYNDVFLVFNKSGISLFPGVYWTFRTPLDNEMVESNILFEGEGAIHPYNTPNNYLPKPNIDYLVSYGDYTGIAIDPQEENVFWFCGEYGCSDNKWGTYIGSYKFIPTTFTNHIGMQNAGGSFFIQNMDENAQQGVVNSGLQIGLIDETNYKVKTQNWKFLDWEQSGENYQHHDWNENSSEYYIAHEFYIYENATEEIANYIKLDPSVTIKDSLLSGGKGGSITLKDPWFLEDNDSQPNDPKQFDSPFTPGREDDQSYHGLFLEQGYNDPNKPYYTVKADAQQTFSAHGKSITGYFLNWEGTDVDFQSPNSQETPVVFHQANAEARAVYKGHLASNISRASGYNNGRRICKTGDGKLHLVYEDDNTIWYTYSSDGGKTWAKEYAISPRPYSSNFIQHTFKNPSIATNGGNLYVVFEEIVQSNSATNHLIDFRKRWNNSWRPIENISDGSWQSDWWNGPWSERPSVAANDVNNVFVSWRDKSNHKIKARYYYNDQTWSYISTIYADGYPATTVLPSGENYPLKIVWSQSGKIKYISGEYNSSSNRCYWSSIQTLSNYAPSFYSNHVQPSVTSDLHGYGYVSWIADNETVYLQCVLYQKFNFGYQATSASSTYELNLDEDYTTQNPSISYNQSNHYVTVFYQHHDNVFRKYLSGNNWYYHSYGSGRYPNICPDASTGTVWTTYTSAPYLLKTESLQNYLSKTTLAEVDAFKRFYFPANDSAYFTLDLKEFDADGQRLNFYYGLNSDTIRVEEPITFNYQIDLGDHYQAGQWLSFYFVADGQKYLLDQMDLSGDEKDNVLNRSVTFDPGKATEGYVQIEFPQATPFVINVVPDNASGLAKAVSSGALQAFTPKSFRLNQNFPNPFNPTTQIVFDLPQESKVTLEVFDISGHKVATLAKGLKEAGRYHVVFDAHNLASGVYIYRLTTDKGFVQSKKIMLIR